MTIAKIKKYVESHGRASLEELSLSFNVEQEKMKQLLNSLTDDADVPLRKTPRCGRCKNCRCHTKKRYYWVN